MTARFRTRDLAALVGALLLAGCAGSTPRAATPAPGTPVALSVDALPDIDGKSHALLADDKPTVLIFWATWCPPCIAKLPRLAQIEEELGDRAHFYGILAGSEKQVNPMQVRAHTGRASIRYPQLRDRAGALVGDFSIEATPTIIVLGPDGTIRYRDKDLPASWETLLAR